jgi:hypothetical protein
VSSSLNEHSVIETNYVYSYVPGDQAGLIATYGGPEAFVKRLDYLHDQNITYIGNEVESPSYPFPTSTDNHSAFLPNSLSIPLCRPTCPQRPPFPLLHPALL